MSIKPSIAIILFLISCNTKVTTELTDQEKNVIAREIKNLVENFLDPNTLSYETHVNMRADVDGYIFAGDGQILFTDYNSYKEATKQSFEDIQQFIEADNTQMFVYVLAKDAAACTTEFKGKYIDAAGDTITHNGCWTFIFKKLNNEWKVVQENGTHTH